MKKIITLFTLLYWLVIPNAAFAAGIQKTKEQSQFPFIISIVIGAIACILLVLGLMWWAQKKK